jgi:uncharacterized C2H2 Zn-finger protein
MSHGHHLNELFFFPAEKILGRVKAVYNDLRCSRCRRVFRKPYGLQRHLIRAHRNVPNNLQTSRDLWRHSDRDLIRGDNIDPNLEPGRKYCNTLREREQRIPRKETLPEIVIDIAEDDSDSGTQSNYHIILDISEEGESQLSSASVGDTDQDKDSGQGSFEKGDSDISGLSGDIIELCSSDDEAVEPKLPVRMHNLICVPILRPNDSLTTETEKEGTISADCAQSETSKGNSNTFNIMEHIVYSLAYGAVDASENNNTKQVHLAQAGLDWIREVIMDSDTESGLHLTEDNLCDEVMLNLPDVNNTEHCVGNTARTNDTGETNTTDTAEPNEGCAKKDGAGDNNVNEKESCRRKGNVQDDEIEVLYLEDSDSCVDTENGNNARKVLDTDNNPNRSRNQERDIIEISDVGSEENEVASIVEVEALDNQSRLSLSAIDRRSKCNELDQTSDASVIESYSIPGYPIKSLKRSNAFGEQSALHDLPQGPPASKKLCKVSEWLDQCPQESTPTPFEIISVLPSAKELEEEETEEDPLMTNKSVRLNYFDEQTCEIVEPSDETENDVELIVIN